MILVGLLLGLAAGAAAGWWLARRRGPPGVAPGVSPHLLPDPALEWLRRREEPTGLAIVDLSMPGLPGLELIRRLKSEFPRLRVLVLSMHAEEQYALRAFQAGAHGYVTKDRAPAELVAAVNKVADGGVYVTASLAERVVQHLNERTPEPRHTHLSDRELDVLRRIVAGLQQRRLDAVQRRPARGQPPFQVAHHGRAPAAQAHLGARTRGVHAGAAAGQEEGRRQEDRRRPRYSRGLTDSFTEARTHRRFLSCLSWTRRCVVRAFSPSGL